MGSAIIYFQKDFFEEVNVLYENSASPENLKNKIGEVSAANDGTRKKSFDSFEWINAIEYTPLQSGDSLFSGETSFAQASLRNGCVIDLAERTLIQFTKFKGADIPSLSEGNIRLSILTSCLISAGGEIINIEGARSEVQIVVNKNKKHTLRILSGKPLISTLAGKEEPVDARSLPKKDLRSSAELVALPEFTYRYRLYDIFEKRGKQLTRRDKLPTTAAINVSVRWKRQGPIAPVYLEVADKPDFLFPRSSFESSGVEHNLYPVAIGESFVRISTDRVSWTPPARIQVSADYFPQSRPIIKSPEPTVAITTGTYFWSADIEADKVYKYFILETSTDPNFDKLLTQVTWLEKNKINIAFTKPIKLYLRVQGVTESLELSELSPSFQAESIVPGLLSAPKLSSIPEQHTEGDNVFLAWGPDPGAIGYKVELLDINGNVVSSKEVKSYKVAVNSIKVGAYGFKISAIDKWGRMGATALARTNIIPKTIAKTAANNRSPAAVEKISAKLDGKYKGLNRTYNYNKIELEFGGHAMISQDQAQTGGEVPLTLDAGIRIHHGWDSHAIEGMIKSKFAGVNDAGKASSIVQLEGRYLYRYTLGFNPFSKLDEIQVSGVVGFEMYRNNTSQKFSPKYDLIKTGIALNFPLSSRWDTGGELLYGLGLDSSKKYEMSGRINYYLQKEWTFGMGYRIHLFEAGSQSSMPSGQAFRSGYREGYGEGYSILQWHY